MPRTSLFGTWITGGEGTGGPESGEGGRLSVRVHSARDLLAQKRRWQTSQGVVVVVSTAQATRRTAPCADVRSPHWREEFIFGGTQPTDVLRVEVRDAVTLGRDKLMGVVEIPVSDVRGAGHLSEQWYQLRHSSRAGPGVEGNPGQIQLSLAYTSSSAGAAGEFLADPSAGRATVVFGRSLRDMLEAEEYRHDVPIFVHRTVEFLRQHGLDQEGIFRLSPSSSAFEAAKIEVNLGKDSWPPPPTVDGIILAARMLKYFLIRLPEPLLSGISMDVLVGVNDLDSKQRWPAMLSHLTKLSRENLVLLHFIFTFLHEVSLHQANNKMDINNLAVVFGPSLARDAEDTSAAASMAHATKITNVASLLIEHAPDFPAPPSFAKKRQTREAVRNRISLLRTALAPLGNVRIWQLVPPSCEEALRVVAGCQSSPPAGVSGVQLSYLRTLLDSGMGCVLIATATPPAPADLAPSAVPSTVPTASATAAAPSPVPLSSTTHTHTTHAHAQEPTFDAAAQLAAAMKSQLPRLVETGQTQQVPAHGADRAAVPTPAVRSAQSPVPRPLPLPLPHEAPSSATAAPATATPSSTAAPATVTPSSTTATATATTASAPTFAGQPVPPIRLPVLAALPPPSECTLSGNTPRISGDRLLAYLVVRLHYDLCNDQYYAIVEKSSHTLVVWDKCTQQVNDALLAHLVERLTAELEKWLAGRVTRLYVRENSNPQQLPILKTAELWEAVEGRSSAQYTIVNLQV